MLNQDIDRVKLAMAGLRVKRKRKKDPGRKIRTQQASEESEDEEEIIFNNNSNNDNVNERIDYEDNLTYHEDSLSVFKGNIKSQDEILPVWITTDSGSMTQLIQEDFVKKLKLSKSPLPTRQWFHINGPGGGKDMVTEYVQVPVQIKAKRGQQPLNYDENNNEEVKKEITLKFGVCSQLPVPILWGGAEMRKFEVIDYHQHKLLSMRLSDGEEYHLPSTSWMMALTQMREDDNPKIRKLYSSYFPTASQMSNMVRGERKTYNLSAVLYPHSDNVVRVGRSNARIDEGNNAVLCLNEQEVEGNYGKSISVIDSICNGESFIIVRNNTMNAIRLNPGVIQVSVKPSLCLPTILQSHEAKKEQQKGSLIEETPMLSNTIQVEEIVPPSRHCHSPKSFMS